MVKHRKVSKYYETDCSKKDDDNNFEIANFVNKTDFVNKRFNCNKTKHVIVENKFKKLETFDSSLLIGQTYFSNDGTQLFLIF